jgi:hypothetical protein
MDNQKIKNTYLQLNDTINPQITLTTVSSLKIGEMNDLDFDTQTYYRERGYARDEPNDKVVTHDKHLDKHSNFSKSSPNLFSNNHNVLPVIPENNKRPLIRPKSANVKLQSTIFQKYEDEYYQFLEKLSSNEFPEYNIKYSGMEMKMPSITELYSYVSLSVQNNSSKEKREMLYWFLNRKSKNAYEKVIAYKAIMVLIHPPINYKLNKNLTKTEKESLHDHHQQKKALLIITLNRISQDYIEQNVMVTDNMFVPGDILVDTWQGPGVAGKWKHASLNVSFNEKSIDVIECTGKACHGKTINKDDDNEEMNSDDKKLLRIRFIGSSHDTLMKTNELNYKAAILGQIIIVGGTANYGLIDICHLLQTCKTDNIKHSIEKAQFALNEILDGVSHSFICSSFVIFIWQLVFSLYLTEDEIQKIFPLEYTHCSPRSIKKSLFHLSHQQYQDYKKGFEVKNHYWSIKLFDKWKDTNYPVTELQ